MPDWPSNPTIEQVVHSLERSTPPAEVPITLVRFNPMSVMLSVLTVSLLVVFLALSWHLVFHVENLVVDIRQHRASLVALAQALPAPERLAEDEDFARELALAPHHAAQLYLIRGRLFAHRGDEAHASEHFAIAENLNRRVSTPEDMLIWARILIHKGERARALTLLRRINETDLTDKQRQEFTNSLLNLAMEERRERDEEITAATQRAVVPEPSVMDKRMEEAGH